jgi:hypothetical protein
MVSPGRGGLRVPLKCLTSGFIFSDEELAAWGSVKVPVLFRVERTLPGDTGSADAHRGSTAYVYFVWL